MKKIIDIVCIMTVLHGQLLAYSHAFQHEVLFAHAVNSGIKKLFNVEPITFWCTALGCASAACLVEATKNMNGETISNFIEEWGVLCEELSEE